MKSKNEKIKFTIDFDMDFDAELGCINNIEINSKDEIPSVCMMAVSFEILGNCFEQFLDDEELPDFIRHLFYKHIAISELISEEILYHEDEDDEEDDDGYFDFSLN